MPSPSPVPQVACHGGASSGAIVQLEGYQQELLYDVADPLHPRLLCSIANTSAHLFTGDTFEYLKPVSANQTDVMLHSFGSGNESHAGSFPFYMTSGAWLPDGSVAAFITQVAPDNNNYPSGGWQVWLYSQRRLAPLYAYLQGIGDCICRFGLPGQVLSISPDGQYIVAGWIAGKGSEPLAVYRVSDRTRVATLDNSAYRAIWDRAGHRLFLSLFGTPAISWTPEAGTSSLTAAAVWSFVSNVSPDGSLVAYTAYADPDSLKPRVYVYDVKAGTTRMLVDQPRSQGLFVKDGWVWYLEEVPCLQDCAGSTQPSGKVFAMQLSSGVENVVPFAAGDDPRSQAGLYGLIFDPGEFWPAS